MEISLEELIQSRKDALENYSPYSFIREIKPSNQFYLFVKDKIKRFGAVDTCYQLSITIDDSNFVFLYEDLPWDSKYFNRNCYKLFTVLYAQQNASALIKAIITFRTKLQEAGKCYCFAEIPAEDIFLIQCLNEAGVKLVETRLHFYLNLSDLKKYQGERYHVRKATVADIPVLTNVASLCRNSFDRLHADYTFSNEEADQYLATYAEAAVNGFCDTVFVPNEATLPTASFLSFNLVRDIGAFSGISLLRVSLAAVAPENKGWLSKLLSEAVQYGKEQKMSHIEYPTQASNRAAINVCEKLGFNLGSTSHILSFSD
ncbi:GNAT family protein [Rufibacter tibetensis]|uniref:N-acetyltransferase domain-containing protein n=1 Tax=Rufibacter tibetensis TaxID=512763 RepID=A0A0P0CYH9_9BACT|nr:hypothetical protein [Rufibacter tibetensis]ALI99746.1 hypothetical protein DC20_13155 [Rufibacter tibetensis]